MPSSVKYFGNNVFYASNLEKAVLENPLDSIPQETFANCTRLKVVTYPASVHKLCNWAFGHCHKLPQLPDLSHIDTLGVEVFSQCYALDSISIPPSITYIPENTFNMCMNIRKVHLSEGLESIGDYAFWQCKKLEEITIPSTVRSIGRAAFQLCKELKTLSLSEGLVSIEMTAFADLDALEVFSIPESVESIGTFAFAYGNNLRDVYVHWQTPLELEFDFLDSYQRTFEMTLHVPAGTAERYASAPYWKEFTHIVEDATGITHIGYDGNAPHRSRPVKVLKDGRVFIVSKSSILSPDGRMVK